MPYQAGDVLLADLDPVAGHEQGGRRPVLVVSGPSYNELRSQQLIVAAITSRALVPEPLLSARLRLLAAVLLAACVAVRRRLHSRLRLVEETQPRRMRRWRE